MLFSGCTVQKCEQIEVFLKRLVPITLLVIYTFLGAFIFHLIEEPHEIDADETSVANLKELREHTAGQLRVILSDADWDPERLHDTLLALETLQMNSGAQTEMDDHPDWNFWNSLFYSFTIYTTIGYGHLTPETMKGQLATVIYAAFGIPLALMSLAELGLLFCSVAEAIYGLVCKLINAARKRKYEKVITDSCHSDEKVKGGTGEECADLLQFPVSALVLLTVLFIFGIAGVLMLWEDWDYWTSLYFCLISFSTIGLGDIVPQHPKFTMLISVFLLIGLVLVTTVLCILQKQIEVLMSRAQENIDKQYLASQVDAEFDVRMAEDDKGVQEGIDRIIYQMPGSAQRLYKMLPPSRKEKLRKAWRRKAQRRVAGTQTEEVVQRIIPRLGTIGESQRSHDDINSLVAMCDFALYK